MFNFFNKTGDKGFEPLFLGSEPGMLPLHQSPTISTKWFLFLEATPLLAEIVTIFPQDEACCNPLLRKGCVHDEIRTHAFQICSLVGHNGVDRT